MNLQGKRIVLGVTGGIAAYKAADLASRLVKAGAQVNVIMTPAAVQFVAPLTFQALTGRPVLVDMFAPQEDIAISHVALGQAADLLIVAPATANTLAKLAHGVADNLLTTTALAARAPMLVAPAMETHMWQNPATQANMAILRERGVHVIGPAEGRLASGGYGPGRMAEPAEILEEARRIIGRAGDLAGYRLLVTAGGTREALDPVRFIGNRSSGKMGHALATAARDRGGQVVLVSAPTWLECPRGVERVMVESAQEMYDAVMAHAPQCDALVMSAAVADYRPKARQEQKIKKTAGELLLELERTPDILGEVARRRKEWGAPVVLVGFAAETQQVEEYARAKLFQKDLDLIVANDVTAPDSGFEVDTNRVVLISRAGSEALPLMTKEEVAHRVWDFVHRCLQERRG